MGVVREAALSRAIGFVGVTLSPWPTSYGSALVRCRTATAHRYPQGAAFSARRSVNPLEPRERSVQAARPCLAVSSQNSDPDREHEKQPDHNGGKDPRGERCLLLLGVVDHVARYPYGRVLTQRLRGVLARLLAAI
jgi:hypothetical protein